MVDETLIIAETGAGEEGPVGLVDRAPVVLVRDDAANAMLRDGPSNPSLLIDERRTPLVVGDNAPPSLLVAGFVGPPGPQGPAGAPGADGIPGPPGAGASTFKFNQMTASTLWTITHNLGRYPSVNVVDSSGATNVGAPTYIDDNTLQVQFSAPFAGTAYLN